MSTLTPQTRVSIPSDSAFDTGYVVPTGGFSGVVSIFGTETRGSGALLSTGLHILTAAHVVSGYSAADMTVYFDLGSGRQSYDVSAINMHPLYVDGNFPAYDIAVITLASAAPVAGYSIYRGSSELGTNFQLVGYGMAGTGAGGQEEAEQTDQEVKRTGSNTYEALYSQTLGIAGFESVPTNSLLFYDFDDGSSARDAMAVLAGVNNLGLGLNEVNSTQGDSGGPTFINGQIAGIVSGGSSFSTDINSETDSSFGEISFDTRVSYYASFIDSIIGSTGGGGSGGGSGGGGGTITNPFPLPLPNPPSTDTDTDTPVVVGPDTGLDIFRFFNQNTGTHFYTASAAEKDNIVATLPQYVYEGIAYHTADDDFPGATSVFRFFNTANGTHFFTADAHERDQLIASAGSYVYEGEAYDVYGYGTGGAAPVYRFYNSDTQTHFYTASEIERQNIQTLNPSFHYEGIAWYAEVV